MHRIIRILAVFWISGLVSGKTIQAGHCYVPVPYKYFSYALDGYQYFHSWQCVFAGLLHYTDIAKSCKALANENDSYYIRSCCSPSEGQSRLVFVLFNETGTKSPFRTGLNSVFNVSDQIFLADSNIGKYIELLHPLPQQLGTGGGAVCDADITDPDATALLRKHLVAGGNAANPREYADSRPTCRIDEIYPMKSMLLVRFAWVAS